MTPLLCLLLAVPSLDRPQAANDFRAANERALEGDLAGAIELYETLIDRGVTDGDVYYNLGNALAQAGRPVEAIVLYERALRLQPGDEEITANIRFLRKQLAPREVDAASLTAGDAIEPIVAPFDAGTFGWIAGAANVLLFALWWLRRRMSRRRLVTIGIGLASAVVVVSLAIVGGHFVVASEARGVLVKVTDLKEGPDRRFKTEAEGLHGGRVRILDSTNGYLKVLQDDGTVGWVQAGAVVRVD